MIDHSAILLACRAKLETMSVATTGSATLTATSASYTRSSGSFVTDGFAPGQEITGSGFSFAANNAAKTIQTVTATTITVPSGSNIAESAGTRTLSVVIPEGVASENIEFTPTSGTPWFRESYVPGPMFQATVGPEGELEARPLYNVQVHVPYGTATLGIWGYCGAILSLFKPGTSLTVTDHDVWVRRDTSPFAGQLLRLEGFSVITVSVPLRVRTANTA